MKKTQSTLLLVLATVFSLLFLSCGDSDPQVIGPGSGTETVGYLVDNQGSAVTNAHVLLINLTDSTTETTTSDESGQYKFKDLPSSSYTLWASLEDTSLATLRESFSFDSGTTDLGFDTMYAPGAILGYAFVGNKPKELIEINIPGTSYGATTDSTGKFLMSPVFPGVYKIHFKYNDQKKDIIYEYDTSNITVNWDDTLNIDTVSLSVIPDGLPASPDTLYFTYDTLNETATLWWPKSVSPDISKYSVKIDYNNNITETDITSDTSTKVNLSSYLDESDTVTVKAYIHSIDSGNNTSTIASPIALIKAVSSSNITTTFEWEIFPDPLDTTIINQPVQLSIKYNNPTRNIDTLLWYNMSNGDTLAITTSGKKSGTDTITYSWKEKGQFKIRVEAIDSDHHFWFSSVDTIHVYSSTYFRPENIWITESEEIVNRRKEHCSATLGDKLYIFGGVIETEVGNQKMPSLLNTIETSSINSDTLDDWNSSDTLPEYLRFSDAISLNGKIFIIGGLGVNFSVSSSIHVFDSLTKNWTTHDILPTPLFAMSACTLNGMIFITGGIDNNYANSKKVYILNPNDLTCSESGELLKAKSYHQAVSDGSGIYVLGGLDNIDKKGSTDMEYYLPSSGSSTLLGIMPQERMFFGAEIFGRKLYVLGGINDLSTDIDGGTANKSVDIYDLVLKSWSSGADLPEDLHSFTTTSHNGLFYIIGGSHTFPSTTESKKVYCYYPFKDERSK